MTVVDVINLDVPLATVIQYKCVVAELDGRTGKHNELTVPGLRIPLSLPRLEASQHVIDDDLAALFEVAIDPFQIRPPLAVYRIGVSAAERSDFRCN